MPTLLEQLRLPPGENLQGKSLVDHVSDRVPNTPPLMRFAEGRKSGPKQYALFTERTKLIVTSLPRQNLPDGTLSKPEVRHVLFNLGADPGERFNIAGEHPQVVAQLKELMRRVVWNNMNTKPELVVQQKAVDEETIRRLESLGYMGAIEEEDEAEEEAQPASQPATQPEGDAIGDSGEELGEPDGRP
jgi:arylsulfatase A-like enzyme